MIFQEKFNLTEQNSSYFSNQFDILITGSREKSDERHMYVRNLMRQFKGVVYSFDTCDSAERLYYSIEDNVGNIIESNHDKSLIPDLQNLIKRRNFQGAKICVDITTLKQGILFLLTKLFIRDIKPARFLAAYTEPAEYKKRKNMAIGETEEYELYDRIMGSSIGVPGFFKQQSSKDILLIAPLGFDNQRLQTIYENLKPKKIIPVVGFPSFVPGWNIVAMKTNYMILKSAECYDQIKTCESSSPFGLYELFKEEFHRFNSDYDVYISPLGTRPHCLGASIFVAKNPSAYLIYDFPVEKKFRSEKVLKANIYNLSKYIE